MFWGHEYWKSINPVKYNIKGKLTTSPYKALAWNSLSWKSTSFKEMLLKLTLQSGSQSFLLEHVAQVCLSEVTGHFSSLLLPAAPLHSALAPLASWLFQNISGPPPHSLWSLLLRLPDHSFSDAHAQRYSVPQCLYSKALSWGSTWRCVTRGLLIYPWWWWFSR